MDIFRQDQVMSGSHGTISIDGEILAEVFEWSAKVKIDRKKINMAGGQTGEKITGTSGEGTIKRYKVNSAWTQKFKKLANTREVYFDLYLEVHDPDATGAEALRITGCWNSDGFEIGSKRGEEITEELKYGLQAKNISFTEIA